MKVGAGFYDSIKKFFRINSYFTFGVEMLIEGSLIHQQNINISKEFSTKEGYKEHQLEILSEQII